MSCLLCFLFLVNTFLQKFGMKVSLLSYLGNAFAIFADYYSLLCVFDMQSFIIVRDDIYSLPLLFQLTRLSVT